MKKKILVTGGAGFIGSHFIKKIIGKYKVVCVDNFNDYYEPKLKKDRIRTQKRHFKLYKAEILRL
jgi:UDP-glucuronate 4-epimerase